MKFTIGVDEAGRGCMWGSVFAGAVVLPNDLSDEESMTKNEKFLLRDSKKLSEKRREEALELIRSRAIAWGIGECTSEEIDRHNILRATHTSMHRAIDMCYRSVIEKYPDAEFEIKIDGNSFRLYQDPINGDVVDHECVIGGDASVRCIAAASIIAKTGRDHFVRDHVLREPDLESKWGIGSHKGYCTRVHTEAVEKYGIHPLHRKSYAPIKRLLGN